MYGTSKRYVRLSDEKTIQRYLTKERGREGERERERERERRKKRNELFTCTPTTFASTIRSL